MARNTFEAWIPEEPGSAVIQRVAQLSAVEALSRREPMTSTTKTVPRSAGVGVEVIAKGAAYGEDESVNDEVVLTARKIGKAIRIADEDMEDSAASIVDAKKGDWATSYAKFLDNAALGVNAAVNGTTVPFTSVYRDVATNASANLVTTAGALDFADISSVFGVVERSDYYNEADVVVVAHTSFRGYLRGLVGTDGHPIFLDSLNGQGATLLGAPVVFSNGAKVTTTATATPQAAAGTAPGTAGNPLLIVGSRDQLILGVRSGPESFLSDPHNGGPGQLTDEWILNMRARRAFAVGTPNAFGVLEVTTS